MFFITIIFNNSLLFDLKQNKEFQMISETLYFHGDAYENRTRVLALRGPRLNRLTNAPYIYILSLLKFFFNSTIIFYIIQAQFICFGIRYSIILLKGGINMCNGCCGNDSILWFVILFLLLFWNNGCCCNN